MQIFKQVLIVLALFTVSSCEADLSVNGESLEDTIAKRNAARLKDSTIELNNGAKKTGKTKVGIALTSPHASEVYLTNSEKCSDGGEWQTMSAKKEWTLGQQNTTATVYAKFRDRDLIESPCVNDTIVHDGEGPTDIVIKISSTDAYISTTAVTLSLAATDAKEMYITNSAGCLSGGTWETYNASKAWTLGQSNGLAMVYAKFRNSDKNESACVSDSIIHDDLPPANFAITAPLVSTDDPTPDVTWAAAADAVSYTVKIDDSADCGSPLETGSDLTVATYTTTTTLSLGTTYYVCVSAKDVAGNTVASTNDAAGFEVLLPGSIKKIVNTMSPGKVTTRGHGRFGKSVDISEDESTMVVGSYFDSTDASGATPMHEPGAAYVFTKSGSDWTLQQKLVGEGTNGRMANDAFGNSVAISNNTIVVGAYHHDFDASGGSEVGFAGAAYVYTRSGATWSLQQKLAATGTNARNYQDYFGYSVDIDTDTIVVGAHLHDYNAAGASSASNAGAAWVFKRSGSTWSTEQKLVGTGTNGRVAGDQFGISVGISGDSIAVGAFFQDYDAAGASSVTDAGATYIFTRSGATWSLEQKLVGTGTNGRVAGDRFGQAVSIDSNTVAIGAPKQDYDAAGGSSVTDPGAAYVYTRTGVTWSFQQKLVGSGANSRKTYDNLCVSIALSGDTVICGAPEGDYDGSGANLVAAAGSAVVFSRSGATWSQEQRLAGSGTNGRITRDYFGTSVAVSGDTAAAGTPEQAYDATGTDFTTDAGAVFAFGRSGSTWSLDEKVVPAANPEHRSPGDNLGYAVALSADGNTLVVGARYDDYGTTASTYFHTVGSVYVLTRSGSNWLLQQKIAGESISGLTDDNFGFSVDISGDTLVIGAPYHDYDAASSNYVGNSGAAYVYTRSGTTWSLEQKIVATGTNARNSYDYFGHSVAIDSETVVIGAYSQDYDASGANLVSNAGAAFVYKRSGTTWSLEQKLVGTGTNGRIAADYFGRSVDISGNTIVAGAYAQDWDAAGGSSVNAAGAAYVFTRSGVTWSLEQKLVGSGANGRVASDYFGESGGD